MTDKINHEDEIIGTSIMSFSFFELNFASAKLVSILQGKRRSNGWNPTDESTTSNLTRFYKILYFRR